MVGCTSSISKTCLIQSKPARRDGNLSSLHVYEGNNDFFNIEAFETQESVLNPEEAPFMPYLGTARVKATD